jgi:deazaflavin-dependent oxidoreductase (nitroreductase family)
MPDDPEYLYLTTIGRRSGKPREIEIWYTENERAFYVIAEYATANWLQNIRANPKVEFRVGQARYQGRARVLPTSEHELVSAMQQKSREKYGWDDGLVVELMPDATGR